MKRTIKKAAVIGSGVMGSRIACHFANIGLDVVLLDIVPRELNDVEKAKGKTLEDKAVRNRIAIEAAGVFGWERYTGLDGEIIGMRSFGASGPGEEIYEKFGITTEAVCQAARKRMNKE